MLTADSVVLLSSTDVWKTAKSALRAKDQVDASARDDENRCHSAPLSKIPVDCLLKHIAALIH